MVWVALALIVAVYIYADRPVPAAFAWERDYTAGLRKASEQKRFVLLEFQTPGCPACEWMDREVFARPEVARALEGWVPIRVDGNAEPKLAMKYGVKGFPSFWALSPAGQVLGGFMGARSADEFIKFLEDPRVGRQTTPPAKTKETPKAGADDR